MITKAEFLEKTNRIFIIKDGAIEKKTAYVNLSK